MQRYIDGRSVKGATHVRNGAPLQDSYKIVKYSEDISIISVADGHGSEKCPRSQYGSQIACNVFCDVMKEYLTKYADDTENLITWLNREGELRFAQDVCDEWKKRIRKSFNRNKLEKLSGEDGKPVWKSVYKLYGTTLLGLLITPSYIFAFQLGDGDIQLVNKNGVFSVIETEKILGTETHSLSKVDAWRNAVTMILRRNAREELPYLYIISTDGFVNSYLTEEDFARTCREYFDMIENHGFEKVMANLEKWLSETSELGCGDDITVALVYCTADEAAKEKVEEESEYEHER